MQAEAMCCWEMAGNPPSPAAAARTLDGATNRAVKHRSTNIFGSMMSKYGVRFPVEDEPTNFPSGKFKLANDNEEQAGSVQPLKRSLKAESDASLEIR